MSKIDRKKWFRLHGDVVAVRGTQTSALYDFHRGRLSIISHRFHDIIEWLHRLPASQTLPPCPAPTDKVLECQAHLVAAGYGHLTGFPERFQPIPFTWHAVDEIQYAVIDYSTGRAGYSLTNVLGELDTIGCKHLELRLPEDWKTSGILQQLQKYLAESEYSSLHLVLRYREETETSSLFSTIPHLARITFRAAPVEGKSNKGRRKVRYQTGPMDPIISAPQMPIIVSRRFFSEALNYNPYYNRRIAIDRLGNIKNDLGLEQSFGNCRDQQISEVYALDAFRQLWEVNADRILQLKDDPRRYAISTMVALEPTEDHHYYKISASMSDYDFY